MSLFRSQRERWEPPAPRCEFLVRCAAPTLPPLDPFVQLEDGGGIELEVGGPRTGLPPLEVLSTLGLAGDALCRAEEARHEVWIVLANAGESVPTAVLQTTRFADQLAERADGVVQDIAALRFFGPGGWLQSRGGRGHAAVGSGAAGGWSDD